MDSFTLRIPTAAQDCSSRARPASPSNTKYCTVTFHTSSKNTQSCFRQEGHSPSEMEAQARRTTLFVAQSPKMPSDRDAPEEAVERRALQLAIIHARAAQGSVPNTKYSPTDDAAHVGEMSIIDLRQEVRTSTPPRHAQSVGICAPPP